MEKFPKAFLLGAATAAHQVEGNNIYSDAWAEEQMKHSTYLEPSGAALDHYHRYEEDIRLMSKAGLNASDFQSNGQESNRKKEFFHLMKLSIIAR